MDHEKLFFVVPHPDGLLDGKPHPSFLMQLDGNGLSVLREGAGIEEFEQTLTELKDRWAAKARKFHGVTTFATAKARFVDDERLCCVYDTALPGKPNHADISAPTLQEASGGALKRLQRARIKKFIDNAFVEFEPAASFRDGALLRFVE